MTVNQERILIHRPHYMSVYHGLPLSWVVKLNRWERQKFLAAQRNRQNYSDLLCDQQMEALVVLGS